MDCIGNLVGIDLYIWRLSFLVEQAYKLDKKMLYLKRKIMIVYPDTKILKISLYYYPN